MHGSLLWRWCGAAAVAAIAAAGCSGPQQPERTPEVTVRWVGATLHDPLWSYRTHALIGLTADGRLAEVSDPLSPQHAKTLLSPPMPAGRNLQISRTDDRHLFVPQPNRNKVAVVDLGTLRQVDEFDAGPAPAYLTEDAGLRMLLALSADGLSVTPVDQHGYRKLATAIVTGDPADTIDGANRGRAIEYHLYGPSGIRYYKGPSSPPAQRGSLHIDVAVSAGDSTQVTRSYVAGRDDGVLYAVDARRGGEGMLVLARTRLSSPIRKLGTDDTRIYAATDHEVVTLETASFTGYPHGTIPVLHVTNYRAGLPPGPVRSAPVSGMAVGPHRVYLTLAGTPYVLSVAKPHL
ncbi:hypothetical protein [Mycobacterium xenopi]|uniref:Uncharacterized protein n=1 Tax=Mycobacterium xenopi TaxID=1789 RepID=A0AAD1H1L9_MYCXE|nr:hypothetical protein AWC32_23380 [Mycobacterium xenopi]BBU23262.1 hypothetical protein MYXE_30520 [Mycobacterium xenopi]SPX88910.1 Uncharacterised protein [Mycobacterium xenopi]